MLERIDQGYFTNNGYYGEADYFIEFTGSQLNISSTIQLNLSGGVTLGAQKSIWEQTIEALWSEQFDVVSGTSRYPIYVDVIFDGPVVNHYVTVQQGPARSNEFLWDTQDSGWAVAHEFGHMLGQFDEYPGGGTDPSGEIIDFGGIMGSTSSSAVTRARYYEDFLAWLDGKVDGEYSLAQHIEIVAVPEPAVVDLMMVGVVLLVGVWFVRKLTT